MARLPRFNLPGQPQHVIQRGNNRQPVFFDEQDYVFYKDKLKSGCEQFDCKLHAYVLMTNHVHLLITPWSGDGISRLMQYIGRYYVQYINYNYARTGTLWEGRYRATLIDSEVYLLACMRYIELNPVRACMVSHASDYPWSSYRYNALGEPDGLVTEAYEYQTLGQSCYERLKAYRALFGAPLTDNTLEAIRVATNNAWVLGSDAFKDQVEQACNRRVEPRKRGGDHKLADSGNARAINRV